MRTSAEVKVFNYQDPIQNTDFGTSRGRTVFHLLKKPVGNHNPKVHRILVPPEILVQLEICAQFERYSLCSTEYLSRPHTSKGFLTFLIQWQSAISQKSLHKTNIYVQDLKTLVPSTILVVPSIFEKFYKYCCSTTF